MNLASCYLAVAGGLVCVTATTSRPETPHKKPVPSFAKDIAPILYGKCASCHHAGEVAPFSLTNYQEARAKARTIAAVVQQGYMPPWQAVSHGEFKNERTLSSAQVETLRAWALAGAPAGDLHSAPASPTFTPGWQMGKPDLIVAPSKPYDVAAEGADEYRCFVIPTSFPTDRYVSAVELRPGNRKVVHHVLVYLDTSGAARRLDGKDGKPGYTSFGGPGFSPAGSLGGWAPGLLPQVLGTGDGFLLPKGADIVIQVHYHKDGKPETDLSKLGLKFSQGVPDKRVRWQGVGEELLEIPPGKKDYCATASRKLPQDVTVLDVIPHMHLLGHDMTVTATLPDGTKKQLIQVDRYDFNWQTRYTYTQPMHLPAGTVLSLVAHYDNSKDNPHNPNNPPKLVTFGEQTTDEMCYAFFSFTVDREHLAKGIVAKEGGDFDASEEAMQHIFDRFDADHDGYLDAVELANLIRFFDHAQGDDKKAQIEQSAKFAVAFYGKTVKGKLTEAEFAKLAKQNK